MIIKSNSPFYKLDFSELIASRFVLWMLIVRDIKLRYKQTVLGVLWVILQPLLTAALFTAVFGRWLHGFVHDIPYVHFAFAGLVPWLFFSTALQRASHSLSSDSPLITKVYFPRIFLPLSATLGVVIDLLVTSSLLLILVSWTPKLIVVPLLFLHLFLLTIGASLFFAALNVLSRDFKHLFNFLLPLWMYATPLLYPTAIIPEKFQILFALNPMTGLVEAFRSLLFNGIAFPTQTYLISLASTLFLVVGGYLLFQKQERSVADKI